MTDTKIPETVFPPIEKSIQVALPVEAAFKLFTDGFATWWPLASHSVGENEAIDCKIEAHEGGRVYEIQKDGSEPLWGKVLVWDPPYRFAMTWHPGRDADTAQRLEIEFIPDGDGSRLELIHHDWELLGDAAEKTRAGYDTGWDIVLGHYLTEMETVDTGK